jgi:hypothetical protein
MPVRPMMPRGINNGSNVRKSPPGARKEPEAPQLGGLFAGGMPKLRPSGGHSAANSGPGPSLAPPPGNLS